MGISAYRPIRPSKSRDLSHLSRMTRDEAVRKATEALRAWYQKPHHALKDPEHLAAEKHVAALEALGIVKVDDDFTIPFDDCQSEQRQKNGTLKDRLDDARRQQVARMAREVLFNTEVDPREFWKMDFNRECVLGPQGADRIIKALAEAGYEIVRKP